MTVRSGIRVSLRVPSEGQGRRTAEVGVEKSPGFRDDQRGRDGSSPARMLRVAHDPSVLLRKQQSPSLPSARSPASGISGSISRPAGEPGRRTLTSDIFNRRTLRPDGSPQADQGGS